MIHKLYKQKQSIWLNKWNWNKYRNSNKSDQLQFIKQSSSILNNPKEKYWNHPYLPKFLFPVNEENQKLKREKCKPPLNQFRTQSVDTFWISYFNQTQFRAIYLDIISCGPSRGISNIHQNFPTTFLSSSPIIKMSKYW